MMNPVTETLEVVENYDPPDSKRIEEGLKTVVLFVKPTSIPAFFDDDVLNQGIEIAKFAMTHFQTMEYSSKLALFEIIKYMTAYQPVKMVGAELCHATYKKIAKLFCTFKEIGRALCTISSLLTPAREYLELTPELMDQCCNLAAFAIKYFKYLNPVVQSNLLETQTLSTKDQPPYLFQDITKKTFYMKIIEVFASAKIKNHNQKAVGEGRIKPVMMIWKETSPVHKPPPLKHKDSIDKFISLINEGPHGNASSVLFYPNPIENGSISSSFDEKQFLKIMKPKEDIKNAQIKIISTFFEGILKHYIPDFCQCTADSPLVMLQNQIQQQFKKSFPKSALQIFFQEPRNVSEREMRLINRVLGKIFEFFRDLNRAKEKMENNLTIEEEQKELVKRMNAIRSHHKKKIIPDDLDRKTVQENLLIQIQEIVQNMWRHQDANLDKNPEIPDFILSILLLEIVDRTLTPYTLSLIIDRLLEDKIDLEDPDKPPENKKYDSSNKTFSNAIGGLAYNLGIELIKCGDASGIAKAITEILIVWMKNNKEFMGNKIQEALNELSNSECSLKPILFCQHVLFKKEGENYVPALIDQLKKSKDEKVAFQRSVEARLYQRLYPLIVTVVKEQSSIAAFFMNNMSSVEGFSKNLTKSLWRLTQQEMLLKMLFSDLLEGINGAINNEK